MVAEGVELHGHAGEVELVEGGYVAAEGFGGAGLYLLVGEEAVDAGGAFGYEFGHFFSGFTVVAQEVAHHGVVEVVVAVEVAEGFVEVGTGGVFGPVGVPVECHGHAYEHHPAERYYGVLLKFAGAVGEIGAAYVGPFFLYVGAFGHHGVEGAFLLQEGGEVGFHLFFKFFCCLHNGLGGEVSN